MDHILARGERDGGGLKTIERALEVLEIIATAPDNPSVKDVAERLSHNLSSTYNIVNTLLRAGYLEKTGAGTLRLGVRVGMLSAGLDRADAFASLRVFAERIHDQSGETVYITRLLGDRVVIQSVVDGNRSLRVGGLTVGFSGAEDRRASGKAVLAYLPDDRVRALLTSMDPGRPGDEIEDAFLALRPRLEEIRTTGLAIDDEDYEAGICCVAAPFFGPGDIVAGSLAASAPAVRAEALLGPTAEAVLAAAREMSGELGGRR